ncbi:MAG: glycosyltransferase family 4 protein [Merismopedia sp. SIO2A8]|nr:glycosyltransferase family 4 protein [Merismopedia sp. SIO2A8]
MNTNASLVPNSIDTTKYYSPVRSKATEPTVGMMYSTKYWKGCDISLKACAIAAQTLPNLKLIAFGLGEPSDDFPLPPNTEYLRQPPQEKIKSLYSQCDAWLFGSRLEGFGRPILESMACRTPVIGTPAGAAPELLAPGGGILVNPEDPEDMAKAIVKVCCLSNAEWQKMSAIAHTTACSYTWDDAAQLCEEAFETAIERHQTGDLSHQNKVLLQDELP